MVAMLFALGPGLGLLATLASPSPTPQPLNDAWWTGPMLAASAGTLPRGHVLVEPYLYDVITPQGHEYGSLTYLLYGVTDRLTAGLSPTAAYTLASTGPSASGVAWGDTTLIAQYGLTRFQRASAMPATAVEFEETLPTGRYDNLGNRPSNGIGGGAYTTSLGFNAQTYLWLPNQRIFRLRFDTLESFSRSVALDGVSVYGTSANFTGHADPGNTLLLDAAGEYSATRNWVPALDVTYRYAANTALVNAAGAVTNLGAQTGFGVAPAIEYNWEPNWGVLLGMRFVLKGRNVTPSTTPAIAINYVH
jgi:hypothetical protein